MRARQQALTVTDAAAQRIQALLAKRGKPSAGIRIGVRSRGCSGLSYTLEYADEKGKFDEIVEDKGVTVLIDPKAVMFILGTEMDYVEEKLQNGFTFPQPQREGPLRLRRILPRLSFQFAQARSPDVDGRFGPKPIITEKRDEAGSREAVSD